MTKIVFFDIDGTLVSFNTHQIPDSTKEAIKELHNKGIKIVIATGRGKDGLGILDDLPIDGYITLNGQYCFMNNEVIYENTIHPDDIKALYNYIQDKPIPVGFTERDTKYFNYRDDRVDYIHSITHNDNHPAQDCSHVLSHGIYQCMVFCDQNEEDTILKLMPHCHSARWHDSFMDVSPIGGSKQHGIDLFLKHYNIDLSETMAFGDGGNDLPMLRHVAISIAMGNGKEEVKEVASYVTDDVDHDGVINALKHFHIL